MKTLFCIMSLIVFFQQCFPFTISSENENPRIEKICTNKYGLRKNNQWILPPVLADIWEYDGLFIFQTFNDHWGFYNDKTQFLYGPDNISIITYNASQGQLLTVEQNDGLYGFMDCYSGNMVIPCQFNGLYDKVGWYNDYVLAADEIVTDDYVGPVYYLYDRNGTLISFPNDIMPYSHVESEFVIIVQRTGHDFLYGLATCKGDIVIDPIFPNIQFDGGKGIQLYYIDNAFINLPFGLLRYLTDLKS